MWHHRLFRPAPGNYHSMYHMVGNTLPVSVVIVSLFSKHVISSPVIVLGSQWTAEAVDNRFGRGKHGR